MKKILLLLIALTMFSCDLREKKVFLRSYVMHYYDVERVILREDISSEVLVKGMYIEFYHLTSLGAYNSTGSLKRSYDALCEKHNDMTYNRKFVIWDSAGPHQTSNIGIDFVSIDIVSDIDFDTEHPAGESLGDIVRFRSISSKPYIDSGYKGSEYTTVEGLVSELTPDQLTLLGQNTFIGGLYFETSPTLEKTHTFTVTMTPDDGREPFTASIEMTFD